MTVLHQGFLDSARSHGDRPAVKEPGSSALSYRQLGQLSDHVRNTLVEWGVKPGDRIGLCLPKSIDVISLILGVLKCGGAYVPIDYGSPAERAAYILKNCGVTAAFVARERLAAIETQLQALGGGVRLIPINPNPRGDGVDLWLRTVGAPRSAQTVIPSEDSPAYILYTSGSTGKPKGVVVSHRAAVAFVEWCFETFRPTADDRFSSHAPLHFDLSIHDLYVSWRCGGSVLLLDDELSKDPRRLAPLIAEERLTIWYSTPSALSLLEQHGHLEQHDCSSLRIVHFAGEVFPIPRLRAIMARWPQARYFNLYGPTETNVCTWHEAPNPLPASVVEPLPIGKACAHYRARVVDGSKDVAPGEQGELVIAGPGVMTGYWNLPEQNDRAFLVDGGDRWYRTGDIVAADARGDFIFHGRRDRMVKRRGYRIELGEIESALARHPAIAGVAVVARADDAGVTIHAYLASKTSERPSIVELKKHCVEHLPSYMSPDRFTFLDHIPQTSTGKADYQALLAKA